MLLSNKFKVVGWFILVPTTFLGLFLTINGFDVSWLKLKVFAFSSSQILEKRTFFEVIETDLTNTLVGVFFILGALMVGFSKEKKEDEFIAKLRLSSLLWSVWVSYLLLLLSFVFVYGSDFFSVMVYNMFTVMIVFILRFNLILYKNNKLVPDEK